MMAVVRWILMGLAGVAVARADRAEEIARIHVEAIGGRARVEALRTLRITGVVEAGTQRVPLTLVAARPRRVRVESVLGERRIVQATDGAGAPWQQEDEGAAVDLAPAVAERFLADAEFDDPLVDWAKRGYRLEFGGEKEVAGRKLLHVLVVRSVADNVLVLLDPQTYFVVLRVQTLSAGGRRVEWVTRYDDYRPVAGVLVPHALAVFEDGVLSQRATFATIEANVPVDAGMFARPR